MPAGRPHKVEHVRKAFLDHIESAKSLVDVALKLERVNTGTGPGLHSKHVRRVVELAFMGIVAAWEEFVEQTMVRFLCGAKAGGLPTLRITGCQKIVHAYQLISGDPDYDRDRRHLNWSSPDQILKKAGLFFECGGTYTGPLRKYKDKLLQASLIRNRVAHSSSKARTQFIKTAKELRESQKLSQGYRVGDLLLENPEKRPWVSLRGNNYFEKFASIYEDLARTIVP
jgi:uncharacterized short protein YbdD (DUF466 family)